LLISGRALIPFALDRSGLAEDPVTAEPLPAHTGAHRRCRLRPTGRSNGPAERAASWPPAQAIMAKRAEL